MPGLSVALILIFLVIVFPLRSHRRKTRFGSTGRANYSEHRPLQWWAADLLFLSGFGLVLFGPVLLIVGSGGTAFETSPPLKALATVAVVLAISLAVWSQETMGRAWRPDLSPASGATLVTTGPFRFVRNPNYTAMLIAATGGTLIAPTPVGITGTLVLLVGLELTARAEEPLLKRAYGTPYRRYLAKTGRFIPGVGVIRQGSPRDPGAGDGS